MLYYILIWSLMGFIIHFYIIFGTNLLTGGPTQNCCFCLFQSFAEKEYQTESKLNETFGNVIFGTNVIQRTWTLCQGTKESVTRVGARLPASWLPRCFLDVHSKSPGLRLFQKRSSRRFHSIWISFDIPFLRNTETREKQQF